MNQESDSITAKIRQLTTLEKYGFLLMGVFLLMLSAGRFVTPSAAFLAPVFLLRYTRNTSATAGICVLYVMLFLSLMVRLHDYIDVPRPLNLIYIAGFALIEVLPFLADRKLFNRLPGLLSTLVLPSFYVVLGFAASLVFPFGSMGERAYSQVGNLELMQLLSVTGTAGITFVIFWFAATMARLWDSGFMWRRCRTQVVILSLVMMIIFVSGGFRNIFDENESPRVRMAAVVADHSMIENVLSDAGIKGGVAGLAASGDEISGSFADIKAVFKANLDDLVARTQQEAAAGAKIISWAEADGLVFESDLDNLVKVLRDAAKLNQVYLVAPIAVVRTQQLAANKLLVFNPAGELVGEYAKARSLSKLPYDNSKRANANGDSLLIDTEYGTIAFAIGFDLDFPRAVRAARDADIIIAPSADWETLSPHHSRMATFRGVENGTSLFRPTSKGVSIASDPHGRIIAQSDHFNTSPHTLVAHLPTRGIKTRYSTWGDWFAFANIGLLLLLLLAAVVWPKRLARKEQRTARYSPHEVKERSRITAIQWRDPSRDKKLDG